MRMEEEHRLLAKSTDAVSHVSQLEGYFYTLLALRVMQQSQCRYLSCHRRSTRLYRLD
jgi:hypothetical protein